MTDDTTTTPAAPLPGLWVESLDLDAQGVAHRPDGKVVFIEGALPFERVDLNVHRRKNNWEQGTVTTIHQASSQRVTPGCPPSGLHPGASGGCQLKPLHPAAKVAVKQRVMDDTPLALGKVRAGQVNTAYEGAGRAYVDSARP